MRKFNEVLPNTTGYIMFGEPFTIIDKRVRLYVEEGKLYKYSYDTQNDAVNFYLRGSNFSYYDSVTFEQLEESANASPECGEYEIEEMFRNVAWSLPMSSEHDLSLDIKNEKGIRVEASAVENDVLPLSSADGRYFEIKVEDIPFVLHGTVLSNRFYNENKSIYELGLFDNQYTEIDD